MRQNAALTIAHEELRAQAEELREAHSRIALDERRFHELFERAPIGYVVTDRYGSIREINAAARELLRASASCVGKPVFVLLRGQARSDARRALTAVLRGREESRVRVYIGEVDTTPMPVDVRIQASPAPDGDGIEARWTLHDLIPLERAEAAERERDQLQAMSAAKDELLGLVSHELRTPITVILGMVDFLGRRGGNVDPNTVKEALQEIRYDAERLADIIENMLMLARTQTAAPVELEPVLVDKLLAGLEGRLREAHPTRRFVVDVRPALPPVMANSRFVEQIIRNLVSNAAKYSSPGEPIELRARPSERGTRVVLAVADRSAADVPDPGQFFEAFYRDPEHAKTAGGIGLGLSVCRRLAEAQEGWIAAERRDGGGLEFSLSLAAASLTD